LVLLGTCHLGTLYKIAVCPFLTRPLISLFLLFFLFKSTFYFLPANPLRAVYPRIYPDFLLPFHNLILYYRYGCLLLQNPA